MITVRRLTPALLDDYLDFFDHRAFADGSPFYPCYCGAFNMSRDRIREELFLRAEKNGGGAEAWRTALRDSAAAMVRAGEIHGYLAYDGSVSVGWCNANDRLDYCRVGEFDLADVPEDEPPEKDLRRGEVRSVVCFEIAPDHRGQGIAGLLLKKVCDDARAEGYAFVEAYPAKNEALQGMAFTGPRRLYEKAGFTAAGEKGGMLIMRKDLRE